MIKRKFKLLTIALLVFLVSASCGSGNQSTAGGAKLTIWGVFDTTEDINPIISAYQQARGNVAVEYKMKNVEDYESDLLNALAAGTGPDIFIIHNDWLPKYKDKMSGAPEEVIRIKDFKDAFVDVVAQDFVSDNQVYAIPFSVDSLALYYNKDILGSAGIATPPKTWEELKQQVVRVSKPSNTGNFTQSGVAMGTTSNINRAVDIMYLLMLQNRTPAYTEDFSRPNLGQSIRDANNNTFFPAADAVDFYTTYSNPSSDAYTWNTRSNYSIDSFAEGELAFMYGYSFTRDQIKQKAPNLNYDIAPVPQPALGGNLVNFANYWGYGVSKQSKNQERAWDFLRFAGGKDSMTVYAEKTGLPSARRDIISQQINDPEIGTFANANLTAKSFYKRDADKVDKIILDMIDSIVLRGRTIQQAVANANQQITLIHNSQ